LAYLTGHIAALAAGEGLTRKMGSAAMTQVQGRFSFTRIGDEYRTLFISLRKPLHAPRRAGTFS